MSGSHNEVGLTTSRVDCFGVHPENGRRNTIQCVDLVMFKSVVLAEQHVPFHYHGFAILNGFALAKVMLTAKDLHLGERFDEAPLIYPTLLKSVLFSVLLACFKILEEAAIGLYHHQSFRQSIADLEGGTLNAVLTFTLLLFVVLIPFVGFAELQRVLGPGKLRQIFFHPRPPLPAA